MTDFEAIAENIQKLKAAIDELPVVPVVEPGDVRKILETEFSFDRPVDAGELYKRVNDLLKKSVMQVTNPRYFGYFNPSVRVSSVVGDMLAAVYNPNLAIWSHSPAGIEIEKHVLDFFMRRFGLDPEAGIAHFTSGGAEANLTAALVALTDKFPEYGDAGLTGIDARPVMYVPATAHDSFVKICHMTGLGRNALRTISVDDTLRLDVAALREQVRVDRENGYTPFFAVGTAGTTAAGIVDPLDVTADACRDEGLWYHVDAAWGGAAAVSDRLKPFVTGIERADSITCDAHKWISVPMGAGMFFCRRKEPVEQAFRVATAYMPQSTAGIAEPYVTTVQWSRRFTGLKVFLALAETGADGCAAFIDRMVDLGDIMKQKLRDRGFELVNDTPLPVACFTHERIRSGELTPETILERIYERGITWISRAVMPDGSTALRTCITSYKSEEKHVDVMLDEINRAMG